jgi:ribosomal protein S27E
MDPDQDNFQTQAFLSVKCYRCNTTSAEQYGFDEFEKLLHCSACCMRVLMGDGPDHSMSSLKPEFQEARQMMIGAMVTAGKGNMKLKDVETIDVMVWIEAKSLKEYVDLDIYLPRFKEIVTKSLSG